MKISKINFLKSSPNSSECPKSNLKEFAFIGRSNVGKSSLINMLFDNKNLAKISKKPGKTNSKNYFFLSKNNNLIKAARNLYSLIRKIKNKGYKKIAVEKIPNIGIGQTINDRLERASKY